MIFRFHVIHIRSLEQELNHLSFKKIYKGNKFKQNSWLKPYIDMNTHLREKSF